MQNLDLDEEEFTFSDHENQEVDTMISELQDIVISPEFEKLSNDFLRDHCDVFTEQKTQDQVVIFEEYSKSLETFIESRLTNKGLHKSINQLDGLDELIVESLKAIYDFDLFKDIMLETKVRVEEEERTIKKSTNKATKGYKQTPQQNIFSGPAPKFEVKQKPQTQDLRPDLFFNVVPLQTPKTQRKA